MRSGAPNPTIFDVARVAGVSKSVVSRALSGAPGVAPGTADRVKRAAIELGYLPNAHARAMSAHRTHTVGVFVRDASTPFYGRLLTAIQLEAAAVGYRAVTATGAGSFPIEEERRALETLVSLRVEGLIVCSGALPAEQILPFARRIPTVVAGRPERDDAISSVYCDEAGGGRGLAEHLIRLGHRCVAVVAPTPQASLTQAARSVAMIARLAAAGVEVIEYDDEHYPKPDGTDRLTAAVLRTGATALMMPNDLDAIGALDALRRRGLRAPEELSVTGYDGVLTGVLELSGLTSWHQPLDLIGALAVRDVIGQIDARSSGPRHQALDGALITGRTAGPPPQQG